MLIRFEFIIFKSKVIAASLSNRNYKQPTLTTHLNLILMGHLRLHVIQTFLIKFPLNAVHVPMMIGSETRWGNWLIIIILAPDCTPIHFRQRWDFCKLAIPGLFLIYFHLLKQTLRFLQQIYVKKCPSSIWCQDSNPRPSEHESPTITARLPTLKNAKKVSCCGEMTIYWTPTLCYLCSGTTGDPSKSH